jgi:hypothetical protein
MEALLSESLKRVNTGNKWLAIIKSLILAGAMFRQKSSLIV